MEPDGRPPAPAPRASDRVPRVAWQKFRALWPRSFRQGDHVAILGPTKAGKTTLVIELCEPREYVIFLATKPRDPLVSKLRNRGWYVTRNLKIEYDEKGLPRHKRIVYWPIFDKPGMRIKERTALQGAAISRAFDYVFEAGGWAVIGDEVMWLTERLRLGEELETYLYQGRTSGISLMTLAQRPAWIPRAVYSQSQHLFIFKTGDRDDVKRLGDIGGVDVDRVKYEVGRLERHEFLYVAPHDDVLLRCIAQPKRL